MQSRDFLLVCGVTAVTLACIPIQSLKGNAIWYTDKYQDQAYIPSGALKDVDVGDTFVRYGSHNFDGLRWMSHARKETVGQWIDDEAAESVISKHWVQGADRSIVFAISPKVGRLVDLRDSGTPASYAVIVPFGTGIAAAYPIAEDQRDFYSSGNTRAQRRSAYWKD